MIWPGKGPGNGASSAKGEGEATESLGPTTLKIGIRGPM